MYVGNRKQSADNPHRMWAAVGGGGERTQPAAGEAQEDYFQHPASSFRAIGHHCTGRSAYYCEHCSNL
jgi:hypothetical protein